MDVLKAALVAAVLASAGACQSSSPEAAPQKSPAPTTSDGPLSLAAQCGCATSWRPAWKRGRYGPAAFVPFAIHQPRGPRTGAVGNFKVMVELRPGARVTIELPRETNGRLALLFDRGRIRKDNAYTLADGSRSVRFETCPGKPTTFVGSIATTGTTKAPLDVTVEGGATQRITLVARASPP